VRTVSSAMVHSKSNGDLDDRQDLRVSPLLMSRQVVGMGRDSRN
jgi:hypothetical protein